MDNKNFKVGDIIKPIGYNEQHTVVAANDEGYVLDNGFKIPIGYEDVFTTVN